MYYDNEFEINDKLKILVFLLVKGVGVISDLKYVLECMDIDDYYNYYSFNMDIKNDEFVEWLLILFERKKLEELMVKFIFCIGS